MENTRHLPLTLLASLFAIAAAMGCDMAGPRQDPPASPKVPAAAAPSPSKAPLPLPVAEKATATASGSGRCIVPRVEPAPPAAPPAARCPADTGTPLALARGAVRFADAPSAPRVSVELARDDAARTRGLMYRTQLDADAGMLFSWDREQPRSFWMLNTCLPLDMLFIAADGTIVGIIEQVPTLNTVPRGVPCPAAHVLEVNAGWARQHGVAPGQKVDIET